MSDSSSDESESDSASYVLYKDRPEWKSVVPLEQDDGEHPVVAIDYTPTFKDCFDYFRAVCASGEHSERVLELTATAAGLNPANYTVWQHRRETLLALKKDLHEELEFIGKMIGRNTKNYQVWHHRQKIVEWLQDPSMEKCFTEKILKKDAKNYHAWQFRQWVIRTFNLWDGELEYTESLLDEDVKNNSAWNQRYFVIKNYFKFIPEVIECELHYTIGKLREMIDNESAWNYMRGIVLYHNDGLCKSKEVTDFCQELFNEGNRSPFLLALFIDITLDLAGRGDPIDENHPFSFKKAKTICKDLQITYDPLRASYWEHIGQTLENEEKGIKGDSQRPSQLPRNEMVEPLGADEGYSND